MKFIKNNSYDIVRIFINQIGITIFSLLIYTAIGGIEDKSLTLYLQIAISVFAVLFYYALLYTAAWDYGAKDKIRIDGGKQECQKYRGALITLYANVPNFILSALAIIFMSMCLNAGASESIQSTAFIFDMIVRFLEAMYIGILKGLFGSFESNLYLYHLMQEIGFFILPIFSIAVTHIGYTFGLKEKKLFGNTNQTKKKQ